MLGGREGRRTVEEHSSDWEVEDEDEERVWTEGCGLWWEQVE